MRLIPKNSEHGWTAYLWLIYLSFFIAGPAMTRGTTAVQWGVNVAGLLAFLALYFRAYWVQARALLACIAGMTLLGAIYTPFNPGAGAFFIYAASFAGTFGSTRDAVRIIAGIEIVTALTVWLGRVGIYNTIWPVVFVAIVGAVNNHYVQIGKANKRLQLAQEEIERLAKVAERERIGRDLHDLLGHTLSLIVLKSELASKLAGRDPQRAAQEIADVERISREALAQVRQAVRGYRSEGIEAEMVAAKEMLRAAGIELAADVQPLTLGAAQEAVLALALRESVTNVVRHSGARRCSIAVSVDGAAVRLVVADDGHGSSAREGAGLAGMRERVTSAGGTLARDGSGGTVVTVVLPAASGALERSA